MPEPNRLKRSLSLPMLIFYGLGTTVGAGIYALTGAVAGAAGMYAPVAFLVSALLVAFSAFSFAELSSRFPRSAGEAVYVREGLGSRRMALAVGLLVVLAGTVSSATIVNGFVGYVQELVPVPRVVAVTLLILTLATIAAWGITESVSAAALLTVVEIGGLLVVVWATRGSIADLPARWAELIPPFSSQAWSGIFAGSFLAFYAFIGFEDMVNVAEEVKNPHRAIPIAIITTLVITTSIYLLVAVAAALSIDPARLAESDAPLSLLYRHATGESGIGIGIVAILAMLNGALIQIIMASRILFGLSDQGELPPALAVVNPRTRTPIRATLVVAGTALCLALPWTVGPLAEATSMVTLTIFALVNLALVALKVRRPAESTAFAVPIAVPLLGFTVSTGFLAAELLSRIF